MVLKTLPKQEIEALVPARDGREALGISRSFEWRLRKAGKLRAVVISNRVFYRRSELERFIQAHVEEAGGLQ